MTLNNDTLTSHCKFCIYTHPVNSKFTLWHLAMTQVLSTTVKQNAEKRLNVNAKSLENLFSISVLNFLKDKNKAKLFVEMLYGNNKLHVASLMIECMHGMHALIRGMRPVLLIKS